MIFSLVLVLFLKFWDMIYFYLWHKSWLFWHSGGYIAVEPTKWWLPSWEHSVLVSNIIAHFYILEDAWSGGYTKKYHPNHLPSHCWAVFFGFVLFFNMYAVRNRIEFKNLAKWFFRKIQFWWKVYCCLSL